MAMLFRLSKKLSLTWRVGRVLISSQTRREVLFLRAWAQPAQRTWASSTSQSTMKESLPSIEVIKSWDTESLISFLQQQDLSLWEKASN